MKTNQGLKTTEIKGKPYVEVNERIRYFRENYKEYRLVTNIVSLENGVCVMEAQVKDKDGNVIANGHAYEKEGSTFINKTSYIENCETSAWGRALANFGIGLDTSIASAEEVNNAIANQNESNSQTTEPYPTPSKQTPADKKRMYAEFKQYVSDNGFDVKTVESVFTELGIKLGEDIHKWLRNKDVLDQQLASVRMFLEEHRREQLQRGE